MIVHLLQTLGVEENELLGSICEHLPPPSNTHSLSGKDRLALILHSPSTGVPPWMYTGDDGDGGTSVGLLLQLLTSSSTDLEVVPLVPVHKALD